MKELPVQEHELQPLAAHIRNEYDAVRVCTTGGTHSYASDGCKAMLRDLLVTALNVHARNLVVFFDARRPNARPDDVYATDYTTRLVGIPSVTAVSISSTSRRRSCRVSTSDSPTSPRAESVSTPT